MTRAVFLGTPAEAVPALAALEQVAEVALVITRPDRPRGRSGHPEPPPVKEAALTRGLPLAQPEKSSELAALVAGCDVAVVAAGDQDLTIPQTRGGRELVRRTKIA